MSKTKSRYLINDYAKSIRDDYHELRDYCKFKDLDLQELMRRLV